jgi:lysozyme
MNTLEWFKSLFFSKPNKIKSICSSQKYPNINMYIDKKGFDFIKNWEKYESKPYRCPAGKMTIGFGHVMLPNEELKTVVNYFQAEELLRADIAKRSHWIGINILKPLTQGQYNALISLAFNSTNDGDLSRVAPKGITYLNDGDYAKAAISLFSKKYGLVNITAKDKTTGERVTKLCQGLVNRRKAEWDMWND